jgi:light-regulated signal transduction histidine kinase (bacteriophytochrome)
MEIAKRERILILATAPDERTAITQALTEAGLEPAVCSTVEELCGEIKRDPTAAIIAQQALSPDATEQLASALREQRQIRAHLQEQTFIAERLRNELAEKNLELAQIKADLRRANLDCEQFVFSASHELREPLRNLAIYSEKLRRKPELAVDEESRQCLSILRKSAERMEVLFRDLLAFMQVAANTPTPHREVNSNAVLDDVLATLAGVIRRTGARIRADTLPPLCMAERHLFQLFEHLIENAIKYHALDVEPDIQIFSRQTAEEVVICIRDNGLGLAPHNQEKVFGLFKRLHTDEEYEGTGLGLAVCQKIAEHYNGHIWVESELGKGAEFCFRLPRRSEGRRTLSAISA